MKALLTSALGGYVKVNGERLPGAILQDNGLADRLHAIWPPNARVLMICSDPAGHEKNDAYTACFRAAFPLNGLSLASIAVCDDRNPELIERINETDVLFLMGGHVPTQNRFMRQLHLKERLHNYQGILIACSAGSMNCAETVYAAPEMEGEAVDPRYERWISGLGLTHVNILPHLQSVRDELLDGQRLIEDIAFADSRRHEIIAIPDGSYLLIDGKREILFGEAYRIRNGQMQRICENNESVVLR